MNIYFFVSLFYHKKKNIKFSFFRIRAFSVVCCTAYSSPLDILIPFIWFSFFSWKFLVNLYTFYLIDILCAFSCFSLGLLYVYKYISKECLDLFFCEVCWYYQQSDTKELFTKTILRKSRLEIPHSIRFFSW